MQANIEQKASFQTLSNSVNNQLQRKLTEIYNQQLVEYEQLGIEDFSEYPIAGIAPESTALAMAFVRFNWRDDEGRFSEANLGGILCFIVDRKVKSRFFRLYDINSFQLLFQCELYIGFSQHYTFVCNKFYCFPLTKAVLGVEFANLNDALSFKRLVEKLCLKGDPQKILKEERKKYGSPAYKISNPINFVRK